MLEGTIFGNNTDGRFRMLKNMFIIIGTPLFPVKGSRIYIAYCFIVYLSLYLTFITSFIGILKNLDDMGYVTESARPGFAMFNVLWTHFFMRYQSERLRVRRLYFTDIQFKYITGLTLF